MAKLKKLFQPIKVGRMELKNRLVMLAMGLGYTTGEGTPGARLENFLAERAKGGVGLILTSLSYFSLPKERLLVPVISEDDTEVLAFGCFSCGICSASASCRTRCLDYQQERCIKYILLSFNLQSSSSI